jgi:hypothetical protein
MVEVPELRDLGGGHLAACHLAGTPTHHRGTVRRGGEVA